MRVLYPTKGGKALFVYYVTVLVLLRGLIRNE